MERVGDGILKRAAGNAGLLLTGKSVAGAMQLATFALAARALGVRDFGVFSIVIAQVMAIAGLAAFESNQAIIRYGVQHLKERDQAAVQALFKVGTLLDIGAAIAAGLIALVVASAFGAALGWDAETAALARWAAPLTFANAVATPKGMLRLFGRFDLLTAHALVTPAARLAAIAGLAVSGGGLVAYVVAWVIAGWVGAAVGIFFGWREAHRRALLRGIGPSLRGLSARNRGVWQFSIVSNLNSSVALIPTHVAVVIVGALLGPVAAGLFRVGREVSSGLAKPIDLVNQALFPDLARLVAEHDWSRLLRATITAGLAALGIGALLTLFAALAGGPLVDAIFGRAYRPVVPLLTAIAGAMTIRSVSFAADPIMYALGRPQTPLLISVVTASVFIATLFWRLPIDGLWGAAWAFLLMGTAGAMLSGIAAFRMVAPARRK